MSPRQSNCLPWREMPTTEQVFGLNLRSSSSVLEQERDEHCYLDSEQLPLPVIDDLSALSSELRQSLEKLAVEPRSKKKWIAKRFKK